MLDELNLSLKSQYVNSNQAAKLLKAFTFADSQQLAAAELYSHLSDKHNVSVMLESITFSSTKKKIVEEIGQMQNQPTITTYTQNNIQTQNFTGQSNVRVQPSNTNYQNVSVNFIQNGPSNTMNDNEVNNLIARVKKVSFNDKMVAELKLGINSMIVNAKQACKIVKSFSFKDGQKQACIILYPHLADKNNISVMFDGCSFKSTKDEVLSELNLK